MAKAGSRILIPAYLIREVDGLCETFESRAAFIVTAVLSEVDRRRALHDGATPTPVTYTCHAITPCSPVRLPTVPDADLGGSLL